MKRNEESSKSIEVWTIIMAVGATIIVLGAVALFFLMSS